MSASIEHRPLQHLVIVGVGLIGGSVAAACRVRHPKLRITGVGRSVARLAAACESGLLDQATDDLAEGAREADLLVVCQPVDQIARCVLEAAAHCRPGTLLTDAGSVKGAICRELESPHAGVVSVEPAADSGVSAKGDPVPVLAGYVPAHPIAGSEKQGYAAAEARLFEQKLCVLTPMPKTAPSAVDGVRRFWESLGMRTCVMTPAAHDAALAATSHAPHVVAAAMAAVVEPSLRPFVGTGLRDTTRIAAGDPDLWTAILAQNRDETARVITQVIEVLTEYRTALEHNESAALRGLLREGQIRRKGLFQE